MAAAELLRKIPSVDEVLRRYASNHIHAVPGDCVAELRAVCRLLDIRFDPFGALA